MQLYLEEMIMNYFIVQIYFFYLTFFVIVNKGGLPVKLKDLYI